MSVDWERVKKIYVDGYNLLFFLYPQPSLDFNPKRTQLVEQLQQVAKKRNLPILCIFDGKEGGRYRGMSFTEGQTADEALIKLAQSHQGSKKMLIVSSDRRVRTEIDALGVPVIDCKTFWKWVNALEKEPPVLLDSLPSSQNFQEFLDVFSAEDFLLNSINAEIDLSAQKISLPPKPVKKKQKSSQPLKINTDKEHLPTEEEMLFWLKEFDCEED